jgi:hypothetical protein
VIYRAPLALLASLIIAFPALAADAPPDERIEVSEDGLVTVELPTAAEEVVTAAAPEGVALPYGTTPDWGNTLRRQVGGLVVADMNGDNLPDVVVACYNSQSFPPYEDWHNMIYYNTGTELEADPSWISADEVSTGDIKVALINGDAFPDIFAANGGFAMAPSVIYFGTAGGPSTTPGWSESGGSTWTNYALPFDLDHDGDIDVATANQGNSPQDPYRPMRLFLNDEGTLATVPAWQSAEMSISNFLSFGDLDGDDWEDLAVSKWANFESGVYKNVMGTLQTTPVWTTGDTDTDRGVAWADVDGDEDPDLALGHDPTLLYTNQAGTPTATWSASGTFFGHQDMAWADVDGDGDDDLAEVHFSNGVVNIYRNDDGTLTTSPWWSFDSPAVGTALAFGDINGDSALDLVVGNAGDVSVMVFYNQLGPVEIFTDGFESGDTSAWSNTVP